VNSLSDYAAAHATSARAEDPSVDVRGDQATAVLPAGASIGSLDDLLGRFGLDPAEWVVDRVKANTWTSGSAVCEQLTAHLTATLARRLPKPARVDGPKYDRHVVPEGVAVYDGRPKLVAQLPDQQAPYHDKALHELVLEWLSDHQPQAVVLSGDLFDFPSLSKHRKNLKMDTRAQESIDAGYSIIRDYREAAYLCNEFALVEGNHEVRLQNYLLDLGAAELVELRQAGSPVDVPAVLSLQHLARMDELGVSVPSSPYGSYPYPRYALAPDFDIWHGWVVRPEAGASALATIRKTGRSGGVGHTHRAAIVQLNDPARKLIGVEAATLAQIEGGLGYEVAPNWENGFAVYRVYPNGMVHPSLAFYRDGVLTWEGWSAKLTARGVRRDGV
jgi:hypothetical protein